MRVVIVPGLAVRSYAEESADELRSRGYDVTLLPAPAWRGVPKLLKSYGSQLAGRLDRAGEPVDLLVGLSVGTQAAAITAVQSGTVRRLLLISPMVDPEDRTPLRLLTAWLFRKQEGDRGFSAQVPDWNRAGIPRILAGFLSALDIQLERVLPAFGGQITIVQPELNTLSTTEFARSLAEETGARFVLMPHAPHSWPVGDARGFGDLVDELTRSEHQ
jgi:pimeloyl-ACP methyl ester carboxylesterase